MIYQNFELLILTPKDARKWLILRLYYNTISDPLPEFCLRSPELLATLTNYKRCSFLPLFLLFFLAHFGHLIHAYTSVLACSPAVSNH